MNKLYILIAYPYFNNRMYSYLLERRKKYNDFELIIDSGAFTAWNTGINISLDNYCKFLDSISSLEPFHAVQLDVVGNPDETYKNYLNMRDRGYDVMPVFTRGSSFRT